MFAGAAFTDQADITVDKEAVDTLVALGVIAGYPDGSFRPNGTITRAEAAKMLYVLRTGSDNASAYENSVSKFTDLNTSSSAWAAGYIKYCESLNIIAGKNATTFDPDNTVTGEELAKMLLVTLGYNAERAGLVGTNWAQTSTALADENGLLDGVNAPLSLALPRQYAALMMYNAIDAPTVVWRDDAYTNTNYQDKDNLTIGEKYMGLKKTTGTLDTVSKESGKDTYKLTIGETENTEDNSTLPLVTSFSKVARDYTDMLDQEVKVLYKAKDDVYGVFATEDSDVLTGLLGDFEKSDSKLKFDGTKYTVGKSTLGTADDLSNTEQADRDATNLVKENGTALTNGAGSMRNNLVAYVDAAVGLSKVFPASTRSSDNKIVALNVKTLSIAKVTYVGSDYINATKKAGATFSKIDTDSANYPSDLKKDDYIAIYDADNFADEKMLVEKLDMVEGKITSTKNGNSNDDYSVMIDGKWYEKAISSADATAAYKNITLKDDVKLVVKDGYFVCVDDNAASAKDVALLVKAVSKSSASDDSIEARLIFPDGKDETVAVKDTAMFAASGGETLPYSTPVMVSYKKSSGKYELTKITGAISGYDEYGTDAVKVKNDKLLTSGNANATIAYIANDATVFVKYTSGSDVKYSVITGSSLKNWSDTKTFTSKVLSTESNGMQYAKTAFIDLGSANMSGGKDITYGYVLESSQTVTDGDTDYTTTLVWNGEENVTLKVEDGTALSEGQVVEYTTNSNGTHDIDKTFTLDRSAAETTSEKTLIRGVVTGFDYNAADIEGTLTGKKAAKSTTPGYTTDWVGTGDAFTLNISNDDYDTVVLFVDTDGPSGVKDGEFQTAAENNADQKLANITYWADGSSNVKIVIVDTQNKYAK